MTSSAGASALFAIAIVALTASSAVAQARAQAQAPAQAPAPAPPRLELAVGANWNTAASLGSSAALITGNPGFAPPGYVLFETESEERSATALAIRAGFRLGARLVAEGGVAMARPELATTVRDDVEAPGTIVAATSLREYVFEGGLRWEFGAGEPRRRALPFLRASAGYVRQLSDDRTVVETGGRYEVGGGARVPLWRRGAKARLREAGVRGEGCVRWQTGGFDLDGDDDRAARASLAIGVLGYVAF